MYAYPTGVQNFTGYAQYFNTITDGFFWTLALLGFTITLLAFLSSKNPDFPSNLHASLFITFLLSLPLFAMQVITPQVALLSFVAWGLSAWFYKTQQ